MDPQGELFERIMNSRKIIETKVAPIKMDATCCARSVALRLSFLEDDPLFSQLESRFVAHLKYPFAQCELSLLCKPKGKPPKPISTTRINFETRMWKLSVFDDNDYAVESVMFSAESPEILLSALSDRWRIENLDSFRFEVDGTTQMRLL